MGILETLRIRFGLTYNKHKHQFESDTIREGEMKALNENEILINRKGKLQYCKKNQSGKWKCFKTPVKLSSR